MAREKNLKTKSLAQRVLVLGSFAIVALLGVLSGALFAYSPDLPEISELDGYTPGTITRIHDRSGVLIGEFATERRLILSYDEIPELFRNAIIAAEDGHFFNHVGFNIPRIVLTMVSNIGTSTNCPRPVRKRWISAILMA